MTARQVIVEADGGARGNPGPAAYGALLRDGADGSVIAQRAEAIGVATNNVAEYRGLIAGLELVREHAPDARVEVRMDSKLVVEQMAGRWRVKHPDMRPLALEASRLAPPGVRWTWVPRGANVAADALVNAALDGRLAKESAGTCEKAEPAEPVAGDHGDPLLSWQAAELGPPTTLLLLRQAGTELTAAGRFSGAGGSDPALSERGRERAARTATWLARARRVDVVASSPLRRARETADLLAGELGVEVGLVEGVAEAAFGDWDGLTPAEAAQRWPEEFTAWLEAPGAAPPGGESADDVATRVRAALGELLAAYPGRTVLAVSHLSPIRLLTGHVLDGPLTVRRRLHVPPGSLSTLAWWADGTAAVLGLSQLPA